MRTLRESRFVKDGNSNQVTKRSSIRNGRERRKANVGDTVKLFQRPFKIVGVYEPPGGGRIKIPLKTMQEQEGADNRASAILVACDDPAQQDEVAARILERFPDDQLIFTRDLPEIYASGVPALNVFIKVVVGVAAAISMLVILLAMYTTVTERTRQIGILKSLGMSKTAIAWVIEQEAIIVSVLGVVVGVLLTMLAQLHVMRTTSLTIEIEPRWVLIALAVGLLGGSIGALYPALRAARQDAVEALELRVSSFNVEPALHKKCFLAEERYLTQRRKGCNSLPRFYGFSLRLYCPQCGTESQATQYCRVCGANLR